jgi:hypothetical protein
VTPASSVQARAKADMKVARHVLAQAGVTTSQSVVAREETVERRHHWVVENTAHLEVWPKSLLLEGRWSVELRLVYDAVAASDSVFIYKGSMGLKREIDPEKGPESFLRYDVDVTHLMAMDEPCHLNILQISPFEDRIHVRLPGVRIHEWELKPTLEYLCSPDLRDELRARYA